MIKRDNNSYVFSLGGKQYELKPNFLTFRFTQGISLTLSISEKHKYMYIGGNMEKTWKCTHNFDLLGQLKFFLMATANTMKYSQAIYEISSSLLTIRLSAKPTFSYSVKFFQYFPWNWRWRENANFTKGNPGFEEKSYGITVCINMIYHGLL